MDRLAHLFDTFVGTIGDVIPIALVILVFQLLVIREPLKHAKRLAVGFFYVLAGLALFLDGLETALFPIGKLMAEQLTAGYSGGNPFAPEYLTVYAFAAAIGFATTLAEPSLIAVALKAGEVSGGAIRAWPLRVAVALGVAIGISLGTWRIVTGTPLYYYIVAGYIFVLVQTVFAPKMIVALAYDSGGVTTSTVTVPLVTALGLGLAATVPGRSPLIDGFGLIAFASLFPIMTVLGYAQLSTWRQRRKLGSKPGV